jgi:hypothetical protein
MAKLLNVSKMSAANIVKNALRNPSNLSADFAARAEMARAFSTLPQIPRIGNCNPRIETDEAKAARVAANKAQREADAALTASIRAGRR